MERWSSGVMGPRKRGEHYSITPTLHWSIASGIDQNVLRHRIEDRAAADRFAEGFAEMAQACVADLCCSLGDVVTAAPQKLRGAFHPELSQILRDGEPDFPGKAAAEIKRTAADFAPQRFECGRIGQI